MTKSLNGTSLDLSLENRSHLKKLFPSVFTETKNDKGELVESIDFEKLKAEIGTFSDLFESRRERYGMDWPGKKDALRVIQSPSSATLKPDRNESVNFDTTENLFIEGDNLEVLKLLQKSYYGKVKMIYIDPPYNTGNEFIYPDNFTESLETYLEYAGLVDGDGKKFSTNATTEGRFHSKWLNMMYSRLYLARNLLNDDGVIFISIGETELSNLTHLMNEIFGEDNYLSTITRVAKSASDKGNYFAPSTDYILVYAKNISLTPLFFDIVDESLYKKIEIAGERKGERFRDDIALYQSGLIGNRPNCRYYIEAPDGSKIIPPENKFWRWSPDTCQLNNKLLVFKQTNSSPLLDEHGGKAKWNIYTKSYLTDRQETGTKPRNFLTEFINRKGADYLKKLDIPFDYAKPVELIQWLISIIKPVDGDLVLDFFAGSGTTADAVIRNSRQLRYIMVQLPEKCSSDSEAFKAGYKTIADIGKERIRRVIRKLDDEKNGKLEFGDGKKQDRGFKVLKLDRSNFKQWEKLDPNTSLDKIAEQLQLHVDHVNHSSTQEDLFYEILLKAGFMPTEQIEKKSIAGKQVFSVADGGLLICLEKEVTKELMNEVAELEPIQFICLDSAFNGNDQLKANAVQTFSARNQGREKANQIEFKTI